MINFQISELNVIYLASQASLLSFFFLINRYICWWETCWIKDSLYLICNAIEILSYDQNTSMMQDAIVFIKVLYQLTISLLILISWSKDDCIPPTVNSEVWKSRDRRKWSHAECAAHYQGKISATPRSHVLTCLLLFSFFLLELFPIFIYLVKPTFCPYFVFTGNMRTKPHWDLYI